MKKSILYAIIAVLIIILIIVGVIVLRPFRVGTFGPLELRSDKTYTISILCSEHEGTYTIEDNIIILKEEDNVLMKFEIVNNNEIKCVYNTLNCGPYANEIYKRGR